jgi:hypothetical protein
MNRAGEAALVIIKELGGRFDEVQSLSAKLPLVKEIRRYEHDLIKQALINSDGMVTHAPARLEPHTNTSSISLNTGTKTCLNSGRGRGKAQSVSDKADKSCAIQASV